MKRIILLIGMLTCAAAAHDVLAQPEGVITYEVKINVHRTLPKEREAMKSMMPEFRTIQDQLFFNAEASLYKAVEEEEEEHDGGEGIRMRMRRPMSEIYANHTHLKTITLQEFMGKNYLIEDSIKVAAWKLGTESMDIHGYPCRRATFYNAERKQSVVAWYTGQLRPFLGPEGFNTLPGAVLAVDINDGERTITARSIVLRALKKNELKVPSGGLRITEEEFRRIRDEQIERLRANGGNIIIRN